MKQTSEYNKTEKQTPRHNESKLVVINMQRKAGEGQGSGGGLKDTNYYV